DFITQAQSELAKAKPLQTEKRETGHIVEAPYFAEEVRRKMIEAYGDDSIYKQGLSIRTSVNPVYQDIAITALRNGLSAYDRRHGYRAPVKKSADEQTYKDVQIQEGMLPTWELALVKSASGSIVTQGGSTGTIQSADIDWAKSTSPVKSGNVVMVEKVKDSTYALKQVPKIQGAIIVMDPHAGRVLAMQGGWNFGKSEYNRATQARRQPGSAFKPFVYLAALEEGLTPSTRVLDAPFEYEDRPGNIWRPKNYSDTYYGPTPLRVGIEKSRNLMTVRLAHHIGMEKVVATANAFGVDSDLEPLLANSLGASETTLIDITAAYAMLVNGGKKIVPTFIDRIQNRYGKTIFQYDNRECKGCGDFVRWEHQGVPNIPDDRTPVSNPQNVYQIVSILEGVAERGTARRLKSLNRPLAGKTGTTNESKDAWFIGFSPDLVVGVYTGFDNPSPLGKKETGSSVALPIFKEFMEVALKDVPATPFRVPEGMRQIRVDPKTGRRVSPLDETGIWEAFVPGTSPENSTLIIEGGHAPSMENGGLMINEYGFEDPYGTYYGTPDYEGTQPYFSQQPYQEGQQPPIQGQEQPTRPSGQVTGQGARQGTGTGGLY
ncbi:MAG: penicillin-binding protein 1A, partial [Bdellovibrionales bacterium]